MTLGGGDEAQNVDGRLGTGRWTQRVDGRTCADMDVGVGCVDVIAHEADAVWYSHAPSPCMRAASLAPMAFAIW